MKCSALPNSQASACARIRASRPSRSTAGTRIRPKTALPRTLARLSDAFLTLQNTVKGPIWNKTTVVAVTEFGRTARINGSGGTDHGTGGLMVLAGGALRGGRVAGDWPGLDEASLFERRDLMPTRDLRAYLGWILHSQFGLPLTALERDVFPNLDMGADPKLLHL